MAGYCRLSPASTRPSSALYRDVLLGRGVGEAGDQTEGRRPDPRTDAVEKGELPDRREDRALVYELLHLVEERRALVAVQLGRLFLVQLVDVGVAAVNERSALYDISLEPGRGVAERRRAGLNHIAVGLLGIALDESCPFDRPQFHPDADGLQIVEHGLAEIGIGRVAKILAAVEAVRMAGLGKQLPRLGRILLRRRWLPEEIEILRHQRIAGHQRVPEGQRLVGAVAVNGESGGTPHTLVMPRRFGVPLVGEIEAE